MPTQKEIDAHAATHIPHEDWCEYCMAGRGRSKPHKNRDREAPARAGEAQEGLEVSEAGDASDGSPPEDASGCGPVLCRRSASSDLAAVSTLVPSHLLREFLGVVREGAAWSSCLGRLARRPIGYFPI